ncbi:MAG TPA: CHAT domain-containing protein [Thermoanaerobaculia bacterium]|nr:CHAT domain-containing protein [Thermoanaerobaculia bacterium]
MPTAWLQHRSALVFFLYFPWFPYSPPSPPEAQPSAVAVGAGVAGESQTAAPAPEEPLVLPGVVIEDIPKGSALEKAGLQVGDVILSWERLPNPPANPEGAKGELTSYFDWLELEVEQVPRGAVVLRGRRGEAPQELRVEPGPWEAKVRPVLSQALEEIYLAGKAQFASGDTEGAVRRWSFLVYNLQDEKIGYLKAWVALLSGEAWEQSKKWEKAIEAYREILKTSKSLPVQLAAWEVLERVYEVLNIYEAAGEATAAALEIRKSHNLESLSVASGLNKLGELAYARGELGRADAYWLQALRIREQFAPQSRMVAESINNLGALAHARGELERAHDYFNRALLIEEQRADQGIDLATVLSNLGSVARARGQLDFANSLFLRALQIEQQLAPNSLEVASSLNNLGALAFTRGELETAHGHHLRALRIREQLGPGSLDVAASLNNLGTVACSRGELDRSYEYHLQALRIEEVLAPRSLIIAASLNNMGMVSQARGEFDRANQYHLMALKIEELLAPNSLTLANSLNNLGTVALALGELDRAHQYHIRALHINKQLAPQSLDVALSLSNLGVIARDRGELAQAHDYFREALRIEEQLAPESLAMAGSLNSLGALAFKRGAFDSADNYYLHALRIREQLAPESLEVANSMNNLGGTALARGQLSRAHEYYRRALESLEHQVSKLGGSYNVKASFQSRHGGYYQDMLALLLNQDRLAEAFRVMERFRAQTFLRMLAERDTIFAEDIPDGLDRERRQLAFRFDHTLKKLAGLNPRDNSEEIEATHRELQKLGDEAGDIEARIRQASPRLAALQYPHPLGKVEAQLALDPGTLLLSYSVGKEKTALFALSSEGNLEVKILPLGEKALRSQVKQLLSLIREAAQGSSLEALRQKRLQAASRDLYAALLGPVAERIAASERLLILPDGPLHALTFAALVRNEGTAGAVNNVQYLAEWKPVHIALSATVFAELKQRRRPAGESDSLQAPIQIAAFGDPVYPQSLIKAKGVSVAALPTATGVIAPIDVPRSDPIVRSAAERGVFDWPSLPYTRHEVEGIASLFPAGTARTFLGPEALEDRIKSLDPKTRILHLAAHGYTDERLPSSSFVALTIPEDTKPDDAGPKRDNGLLQVWEIFERVRLHADLVVLSACDTGLGEEQGGEGLIGLTRAFQYAGARTVMASLWSVQDQATSELMIRFYKHLRAGKSKDEALRQAQIELIRSPIEVVNEKGEKTLLDASAPYYWAGFQVYGDWQ